METNRIYLLGFMGAGKSYIGKLLAQQLNYSFIDLDDYIVEQSAFDSIPEIFEQKGEPYFRQLERQSLVDSQSWKKVVIATGGGSPYQGNNIQLIKNAGYSIFLDPPISILQERLWPERAKRPLIANLKKQEVEAYIAELLIKRRPFYEQANVILDEIDESKIIESLLVHLNA